MNRQSRGPVFFFLPSLYASGQQLFLAEGYRGRGKRGIRRFFRRVGESASTSLRLWDLPGLAWPTLPHGTRASPSAVRPSGCRGITVIRARARGPGNQGGLVGFLSNLLRLSLQVRRRGAKRNAVHRNPPTGETCHPSACYRDRTPISPTTARTGHVSWFARSAGYG